MPNWDSESIANTVCNTLGHKFQSIATGETTMICPQCGLSLEEVRNGKKKKEPANAPSS